MGREVDVRQALPGRAALDFVIGPDGKVVTVFEKVSPKTHDDVVLAALAESAAGIPQATDT